MQVLPNEILLMIAGFCEKGTTGPVLRHISKLFANNIKPGQSMKSQMYFNMSADGLFDIVKWMVSTGYEDRDGIASGAAYSGHIDIIEYALEQDITLTETTIGYAACSGNLKALRWLREKGCPWNANVCFQLAFYGHLESLVWALDKGCPSVDGDRTVCRAAALNGKLNILEAVMDNPKYGESMMYEKGIDTDAVIEGHVNILDWLYNKGKTIALYTIYYKYAACGGHLNVMKWLYSKSVPLLQSIVDDVFIAALEEKKSSLSIIEWVVTTFPNLVLEGEVLDTVYEKASSDLIRWLVSNNYGCNESICANAAERGNYDLLMWLVDSGCPRDGSVCAKIVERGDLEMLKEMIELGCEIDEQSFSEAAGKGDIAMLGYLLVFDGDRECNKAVLESAAVSGHLNVIKWALDVGYEITDSVLEYAELGGHQEVIEFCTSHIGDY